MTRGYALSYICHTIHTARCTVHKLSTSGQNSLPVVYELLFSFFNNLSTCLSTMNRTHLEGAAEKLTAQRGYTFYTGPEGDMGHTVRNYPAA